MPKWSNWDHSVKCRPRAIERPASANEVVDIVNRSIEAKTTVRTFGAGHSWSPLVATEGTLVNLDNLCSVLSADRDTGKVVVEGGIRLRQILPELQTYGLTMRNVGAITPQSISGAMSTGTHGTGLGFGIIGTQVSALRIVDGRGELREFTLKKHPTEMAALRLSLGSLGIIVDVTVDCVPDHHVELHTFPLSFGDFLDGFEELYKQNERVRFYWFPGSKKVFVNTMNTTEKPIGLGPVYSWFESVVIRKLFLGALWGTGRLIEPMIPGLNSLQETLGYKERRAVGPCYQAITTPIPPRHQEAEVAVPLENARKAIEAYGTLVQTRGIRINVPSEIRFTKQDDLMLSPCQRGDVCFIGAYTATYEARTRFFATFCSELQERFGGLPHWGKIGAPDRKTAQALFPRFGEFEDIRRSFDPNGVFANAYLKRLFKL